MFASPFKKMKKEVAAILWFTFSLFLALSLYSYSPNDPSWNSLGTHLTPTNWCGYLGSFTADFLYQLVGMSAWVSVIFFALFALRSLREESKDFASYRNLFVFFLLMSVSALSEIYFSHIQFFQNKVSFGGALGSFFATYSQKALNSYGATLALLSVAMISLVVL